MCKNLSHIQRAFHYTTNIKELFESTDNQLSEKNRPLIKDIRGSLNKFPDFFRMGTFIDSTHMKL